MKHMSRSLFLKMLQVSRPATFVEKKPEQSCEYCETFKSILISKMAAF